MKVRGAVLGSKRLEGNSLSIAGAWANVNKLRIHMIDQGSFYLARLHVVLEDSLLWGAVLTSVGRGAESLELHPE